MDTIKISTTRRAYSAKPRREEIPNTPKDYNTIETTTEGLLQQILAGHGWTMALDNGRTRRREDLRPGHAIGIDIDHTNIPVQQYIQTIADKGLPAPQIWYYTYSSTAEEPRYRIIWLHREAIAVDTIEQIVQILIATLPDTDRQCSNAGRIFFGTVNGGGIVQAEYTDPIYWYNMVANYRAPSDKPRRQKLQIAKELGIPAEEIDTEDKTIQIPENFPYDAILRSNCELYRRMVEGEYLTTAERVALYCNTRNVTTTHTKKYAIYNTIVAGISRGMERGSYHNYDEKILQIEDIYRKRTLYKALPICSNGTTIAELLETAIHAGAIVPNPYIGDRVPVEEGTRILREYLDTAIHTQGIDAIEAGTGIGKTEEVLRILENIQPEEQILYVAPAHKNAREFLDRAKAKHLPVAKYKYIADLQYTAEDYRRMAIGLPANTKDAIRSQYIADLQHGVPGVYICTHAHYMGNRYRIPNTAIVLIDETPATTMVEVETIPGDAYRALEKYIQSPNAHYREIAELLQTKKYTLLEWYYNDAIAGIDLEAVQSDIEAGILKEYKYRNIQYKAIAIVDGNILLYDDYSIPARSNTTILSATPKRAILERKIPSLRYWKVPAVEHRGKIVQLLGYSGAKGTNGEKVTPELLAEIAGKIQATYNIPIEKLNILTYMVAVQNGIVEKAGLQVARDMEGKPLYLGAERGIDNLKNLPTVTIGKYDYNNEWYRNYVLLYMAPELLKQGKTEDEIYAMASNLQRARLQIDIGPIHTTTTVFLDEDLRKVQLENIEEEAVQATGRSRIVRYDTIAFIASNIPLLDADEYIV